MKKDDLYDLHYRYRPVKDSKIIKPEPEFTESPINGDLLQIVELRKVINGEVFKRTPDAITVYIRNHYDRATKSYSASDYEDMNKEIFIKADKKVFVGFTF